VSVGDREETIDAILPPAIFRIGHVSNYLLSDSKYAVACGCHSHKHGDIHCYEDIISFLHFALNSDLPVHGDYIPLNLNQNRHLGFDNDSSLDDLLRNCRTDYSHDDIKDNCNRDNNINYNRKGDDERHSLRILDCQN